MSTNCNFHDIIFPLILDETEEKEEIEEKLYSLYISYIWIKNELPNVM